jgi:hypothetical protein
MRAADVRWGSFATKMRCPRYVRFPPKATEERTSREVRKVPISDSCTAANSISNRPSYE